jgi:hypothetical protein
MGRSAKGAAALLFEGVEYENQKKDRPGFYGDHIACDPFVYLL